MFLAKLLVISLTRIHTLYNKMLVSFYIKRGNIYQTRFVYERKFHTLPRLGSLNVKNLENTFDKVTIKCKDVTRTIVCMSYFVNFYWNLVSLFLLILMFVFFYRHKLKLKISFRSFEIFALNKWCYWVKDKFYYENDQYNFVDSYKSDK